MRVKYQDGVFKPLHRIKGVEEGEVLEIHLERSDWNKLAQNNKSFDFLKNEPDIYTQDDILED